MIPSDLAARLRMITEASFFDSEPPIQGPARVREIQARLPELAPGERFTATLQRALPDGTFQALVAGRSYTLALNTPAKSGDTLELVAMRSSANTVFAQLAEPQQQAAAAAGEAARPTLSPVGRLIGFLLTGQPTPKPAELAAGKPLLTAPPSAGGAPLAPVLQQAIARSGLFYEAHQKQWLSGKLDARALQQEPQGQVQAQRPGMQPSPAGAPPPAMATSSPSGQPAPGPSVAAQFLTPGQPGPLPAGSPPTSTLPPTSGLLPPAADAASEAQEPSTQPQQLSPLRSVTEAGKAAANPAFSVGEEAADLESLERAAQTSGNSPAQRAATIPERLLPVVHQQLDALATQNYVWQGQVWPGQMMEWEIEDPEGESRESGDEAAAEWKTTLRLTLPRLGGVEARLILTPAGVALRLRADADATVVALIAAQDALSSALAAADLPLTGFVAERRDDNG